MSALLATGCGACVSDPAGPTGLRYPDDSWGDRVWQAADLWNRSLVERCPDSRAFWPDPSGLPVRMVAGDTDCGDGTAGCETADGIEVHGRYADLSYPTWAVPVLLHEMGHRLGLAHSTDPESVMQEVPTVLYPSPADVEMAARTVCP